MYGNIKSPKKSFNKSAVNDRRIIKGLLTELSGHKLLGEMIREGYNKAAGEPNYNLDRWYNEFPGNWVLRPNSPKQDILKFLQTLNNRNGFVIGKLMRACWVDVEVRIAEVPYRYIYSDYL